MGADGRDLPMGVPKISGLVHTDSDPFQTPSNRQKRKLEQLFGALAAVAPEGYSAGLHIRFTAPLVYRTTYTESWTTHYKENVFALRDPAVFWGLGTKGQTRWSEIRLPDPFNIFGQAKAYGLRFGVVISHGPITSRSIVGLARADREFTDREIDEAAKIVFALHDAAEPPTELTYAQSEALRLLSEGDRHAAAASKLGISESALKARLKSARIRLGARTTAEAVRKAREYHFI